ncbi:MAG TPA: fimbria/pilus periplasmic chaperone [Candidatus Baltobacteraceae bacterium]|nr:fimbria/pilus periplasmic chaperone [Candidatus Baltobacteraceae bacterium]
MSSAQLKGIAAITLAALTVCASCIPAVAGAFNVKPIRVFLSKDGSSTVVTIENQDQNVLRLQVRAYAWTNDSHGQPVLAPTDDLIVFPTLVDVNPMEHRSIRIGYNGAPGTKELTYRIALDEMPSLESQISKYHAPGLQVRTRVTIPVFFTPMVANPDAKVSDVTVSHSTVRGKVVNNGNVHATVSNIEISGRDAGGGKVFDKQINGWYVLAGETWNFEANLGRACAKVRTIDVTMQSDVGRVQRTLEAPAGACR